MSNPSWLVRAMDAVERVLTIGVKIQTSRAHWIVRSSLDVVRKWAEPALLTLGRRPSRPFFLASDRRHAGPSLAILAHDRAVANGLFCREHVVKKTRIGIDYDRAWRFLPVKLDDLS